MVSFTEAIKTCITKKFATISGRATRAEFWWFQLFNLLVIFVPIIIGAQLGKNGGDIFAVIAICFMIIMYIPGFCVNVRRLHDGGHSGWYTLWCCIPYVGGLILLIAWLQGSDRDNEYGPSPSSQNFVNSNTIPKEGNIQESPTKEEKIEVITDVDL
ncbi:MAG: DUF805 domain-containing protein [Bacteroidaceae bacterium]|nr:DUF805 domain-containing protein [Bacteroidaceae bacterium]